MKEVPKIATLPPDEMLIDHLSGLLKEAEAGSLRSIMYVTGLVNGNDHGWAGSGIDNRMIGELDSMKFNIFSQMYFPEEE